MSELIDNNHILPHRLFAMIGVVNQFPRIKREDLLNLVQPTAENQETSKNTFLKCQLCGLIQVSEGSEKRTTLAVDPKVATDFEAFRAHMQSTLLGVTEESQNHFILNQFTAWYAVNDQWVVETNKADWEVKFNDHLYPHERERVINEHPGITTWIAWADFLGWGWPIKFGTQQTRLVPDCTLRLRPLISALLPEDSFIPYGVFAKRLADRCPELDGGLLFKQCLMAAFPHERRGNRLSLMLSTALRVLHEQGHIVLEKRADATETWTLFPAQTYHNQITHIRRG